MKSIKNNLDVFQVKQNMCERFYVILYNLNIDNYDLLVFLCSVLFIIQCLIYKQFNISCSLLTVRHQANQN